MVAYLNAVLSGEADPLWLHGVLLFVSILAAFTVGTGILLESPKYSAATHRLATWLVLGGIAVESSCTVMLFYFDEQISAKQQSVIKKQNSQIIALESKFIPRVVSPDLFGALNDNVLPLLPTDRPPAIGAVPANLLNVVFAQQLASVLRVPVNQGAAQARVGPASGVVAAYVTRNERGKKFAEAFVKSLTDNGIAATAQPGLMEWSFKAHPGDPKFVPMDPNAPEQSWVVIAVGDKP